jgi:hypothetical protein
MRYTSLAVFLGTFWLFAYPGSASAQAPGQFQYGGTNGPGFVPALTGILHQHGPLYNYGPYYGYPPFEPYGPWNAYLQYNPWFYGYPQAHTWGHPDRDLSGHGAACNGGSCSSCGPSWHSAWMHGGWYHGCSTCSHGGIFTGFGGWGHLKGGASCGSCGTVGAATTTGGPINAAFNPEITDPVSRYAGAGNAADFGVFYTGLPTLSLTVSPAGGIAK